MGEPNWADFFPEQPKSKRPRRKKAEAPKKAAPADEKPIEVTDDMIVPDDEEAVEVVDDKDILETEEADEDEEDAAPKPGEETFSAEEAEAAVEGAERAEALQKMAAERQKEAEDKVIELDEQIRKKEAEMKLKFSQLDARTDRDVAGRQKKVFEDVYNREIGKLKEMSAKLRERHGITAETVASEDVEEIPETDADRQEKEKTRLQGELSAIETKIKRVELDLGPAGLKDDFERLSDQAAASAWGKLKLGVWKMRLSGEARKLVDEYKSLTDE
ncbi:hypothetical protein HY633_03920 [Candidatus Uhrbacteria bacterium]|nr:hypothetical protein [Candidatus Uhrbacteria bacterium]